MPDEVFHYPPNSKTCAWWANSGGHRLFTMVDTPAGEPIGSALLLPPFGQHLNDMFSSAFHLKRAGFRTIRFDCRNNEGASEGAIFNYKLGTLIEDARFAAAQMVERFGSDDFLIFGTSLSAPVALLLAKEYVRARLYLLSPIIDVARTIDRVSGRPGAMDEYRRGAAAVRVRSMFGHDVDLQAFSDDLDETGLRSADELLALASAARGRADMALPTKDEYSPPALQHRLVEALDAEKGTIRLEQARHNLSGSPSAAKRSFAHMMEMARSRYGATEAQRAVPPPGDAEVLAAAKFERDTIHGFFERPKVASQDLQAKILISSG